MFSMSMSNITSHNKRMGRSGNPSGPMTTLPIPIACRICERAFFDNVSLLLHFDSHLEIASSISIQNSKTLSALHIGHVPLEPSEFSYSSAKKLKNSHEECSKMNHSFIPGSSAVCFAGSHDVLLSNIVKPEPNMINLCLDAHANLSPLNSHRTMNQEVAAPSSTRPSLCSQYGKRGFVRVPFADKKRPLITQSENPNPEIIVISDGEDDDSRNPVDEIDLTLKL